MTKVDTEAIPKPTSQEENHVLSVLAREISTFKAVHDRLLAEGHVGKFVLIHENELAGLYDSERDAIEQGYRQFGNVPFLVKCLLADDEPAEFFTGLSLR